jgi:metal transporter CNNM
MADPNLRFNLIISSALVLIGGAFSGLAIALMTQDEVHLQVLAASGEISDQKNASKVLALLKRGKHWILVGLLLGNTMTNEALPVVLDEILGGGLIAVVGSTVLIVIFGEIIPQSICARHALRVGAWMVSCVSIFMYIISPIAWPIAKLLDILVGHNHGTIYKRSELMALFSFHETLGKPEERLNSDEVMIIHGALGMKQRSAACIMTPIKDVFSLSADAVLDDYTMDRIHVQGYLCMLLTTEEKYCRFVPRDSIDQVQPQILQTSARFYPGSGSGGTFKYELLGYFEDVPAGGVPYGSCL